MKPIDWTKIKEDESHWVVTEEPDIFTARHAKRSGKRLGPKHLCIWSSFDAAQAQSYLRRRALCVKADHTCAVCGVVKNERLHYAYLSGKHYCSEKCYDTLFGICLDCGQRNMTCLTNAKPNARNPSWGGPENHICDQCHQKKHGWHVMTISMK